MWKKTPEDEAEWKQNYLSKNIFYIEKIRLVRNHLKHTALPYFEIRKHAHLHAHHFFIWKPWAAYTGLLTLSNIPLYKRALIRDTLVTSQAKLRKNGWILQVQAYKADWEVKLLLQ